MAWFWTAARRRYRPQQTADLPRGREPETPAEAFPKQPDLVDWPPIQSRHPNWWQLFRLEQHGTELRPVLIAETRTEDEAFRIAAQQVSQVRLTKWGSKLQPYESYRPRMVITGTVERADG